MSIDRANHQHTNEKTVVSRPTEETSVVAGKSRNLPEHAEIRETEGQSRETQIMSPPPPRAFCAQRYRGVSVTGTPDGAPSTPQQIQLYPRTRKGERLLQDAENRRGMRWSPTPTMPWKTLERMATHDQVRGQGRGLRVEGLRVGGGGKGKARGEGRATLLFFLISATGASDDVSNPVASRALLV